MAKPLFIPAKHDKFLLSVMDSLNPWFNRIFANIQKIDVQPALLKKLATFKGKRVIVLTNHPTQYEMTICYALSQYIGDRFNFMGSRRAFDYGAGLVGAVMSNTGSFSIIPGTVDKQAMKAFRNVLLQEGGKLALAPEGEPMSGQNSVLMPMQSGIFKLALGALKELQKGSKSADILIQPIFIRYSYSFRNSSTDRILRKKTRSLEETVGLDGEGSLQERVQKLSKETVVHFEKKYNIHGSNKSFQDRWQSVQQLMMTNIADQLAWSNYPSKQDPINQLRSLATVIELIELDSPVEGIGEISPALLARLKYLHATVYEMIAIDPCFSRPNASYEEIGEQLLKLESLLKSRQYLSEGGRPSYVPRVAHVLDMPMYSLADLAQEHNGNGDSIRDTIQEKYLGQVEHSRKLLNYPG